MPPDLESLDLTLRFTQALQFARRGRLREAEQAVVPGGAVPQHPVALQAVAALATAGGDYRRALQLWRLLLQREPGSAEARRMIAAIELWQARPAWYRFILPAGGTFLGVVLVVVLLSIL